MKLDTYNRRVMHSGNTTTQFSATLNGAAFDLISNNIYQYKIAAVVREIACNAYDSHVEAGKESFPFHVILPGMFNPNFIVEDFGIGLDDDGVRCVFASYFNSSKNHTNSLIGGKGIGAKSIFAYSDTFMITARKDGIQREYTAFIGADGIPEVSILSERETDLCNGVKVTVPVQEKDFNNFAREAEVILSFFKTKPEVLGKGFDFAIPDLHDQIEKKGYATINKSMESDLYDGFEMYVMMGGILYPVKGVRDKCDPFIRYIGTLNTALVVPFDIGTLNTSASRESLSMDENTSTKLVEGINHVIKTVRENYQTDVLGKIDNAYKALKQLNSDFRNGLQHEFVYRGRDIAYVGKHKLKIPNASFYRIDRNHYSKRSPYTVTSVVYNLDNLSFKAGVVAFYMDSKKASSTKYVRSFTKRAKTHCKKNAGLYVDKAILIFSEPVSETRMSRVSGIFDGDVQWVECAEIIEKGAPRVSDGLTYDNGEKKETTLYVKEYIANSGHFDKIRHVCLADTKRVVVLVATSPATAEYLIRTKLGWFVYQTPSDTKLLYFPSQTKAEVLSKYDVEVVDFNDYCNETLNPLRDDYIAFVNRSTFKSRLRDIRVYDTPSFFQYSSRQEIKNIFLSLDREQEVVNNWHIDESISNGINVLRTHFSDQQIDHGEVIDKLKYLEEMVREGKEWYRDFAESISSAVEDAYHRKLLDMYDFAKEKGFSFN